MVVTFAPNPRLRRRLADWLFGASVGVAALVLLYLGRTLTFFQDEWTFISADGLTPADYFVPHNEHWSTIPHLVYAVLLSTIGLRSYLPYLVVLLAFHVAAVAAVYVLLRRRLPSLVALLVSGPLLLLGSGYENLLWAFQVGFVGSVTFGVWSLVALEGRGRAAAPIAAGLLVLSLACSGQGLFFLGSAVLRVLVDPALRRRVAWLLAPIGVYLIWYLTFGRSGMAAEQYASPWSVLSFGVAGMLHAIGSFSGVDRLAAQWPAALLGATVVAGLVMALKRGVPALAVGALGGFLVMYFVIGAVRADLASDFENRTRYVYVAAFFLVLGVGDLLATLRPRWTTAPSILIVMVAGLIFASNALALRAGVHDFRHRTDLTRAFIVLELDPATAARLSPASLPLGLPPPERMRALVARYGSPLTDEFFPSFARPPSKNAMQKAESTLSAP